MVMQKAGITGNNRRMVTWADVVQAASRMLGEDELALYLDVDPEQLRRYGAGLDEPPRLIALRVVDLLLAESAHPSSTLEAMAEVLNELTRQ